MLIVPEHQPSAGNVPGSLTYPLCHLGGGQVWSVLCRARRMALSVYISASSEAWPALRLELDTYYLTYLPLLSLTLTKGDRALYSLSSLAALACPERPLAYTVMRSPTVMAMWWIQCIENLHLNLMHCFTWFYVSSSGHNLWDTGICPLGLSPHLMNKWWSFNTYGFDLHECGWNKLWYSWPKVKVKVRTI